MIRIASSKQFEITWYDSGREPRIKTDPRYPHGIDINLINPLGPLETACKVNLPYPAKRIGAYRLRCRLCNKHVSISTAGRSDDPRSVIIACNSKSHEPPRRSGR